MKPLNEVKEWEQQISEELRQATLDTMIELQIKALERTLESNAKYAKSPMAYNTCAGLIEQLRYYAPAIFRTGELNFDIEVNNGLNGRPLYGKP